MRVDVQSIGEQNVISPGFTTVDIYLNSLDSNCALSRDSTGRRITPMRDIKRPICWTLKKYLVGENDLLSLPTNIDNLPIVLCPPIRH